MRHAMQLAARAERQGEVPVGAVMVCDGQIVGEGWNRNIGLNDPTAHAEIIALRQAGEQLGNHRLPECTLYVTLEPCAMCVGACIHARLRRLVFGADDPKTGALGGCYDLQGMASHNHSIDVEGGVLKDPCAEQLRAFFRDRRTVGRTS
jgi:tRNA(adenine34) deaminase